MHPPARWPVALDPGPCGCSRPPAPEPGPPGPAWPGAARSAPRPPPRAQLGRALSTREVFGALAIADLAC